MLMSFRFKSLSFLLSLSLSAIHAATTCNGSPDLCSKTYNSLTYIGAHDSYAIGPTTNIMVNQDQPITTQLNDGIRLLQMQAHNKDNVITLCHTSCDLFNGGSLETYLKTVKSWMDSNPNEVLTLLIVNINNIPAAQYAQVFASVGLDKLSYAPTTAGTWPTLGELIDANTRLITFLDNQASPSDAPYLLDEFTNIWETKYNVVDPVNFDCSPDRGSGAPMSLINHFYDQLILGNPAPWPQKANTTNGKGGEPESLSKHVEVCKTKLGGKAPNFILLDWYEFAGTTPFEIAAQANGIPYSGKAIASPSSTATGSAASNTGTTNTARNRNGNGNGAAKLGSGVFGVAAGVVGMGLLAI